MPKELSAQQVGTQRRNTANDPKTRVITGMTKFPMSYKMPNTARYGHITPFYYQHSRGDDVVPLFSEHDLRTYTLQSPMLSDVNMNKTYFMVDLKAIYPRNWNLMFVNPSKGDDVPEDTRAVVRNLLSMSNTRLTSFKDFSSDESSVYGNQVFTDYLRFILFLESVYSNGSLFSEFDIHLTDFFKGKISDDSDYISFDKWFDSVFIPTFNTSDFHITIEQTTYAVSENGKSYYDASSTWYRVPFRRILELMRENRFSADFVNSSSDTSVIKSVIATCNSLYFTPYDTYGVVFDTSDYPINLEVIIGYQLGCAQFFTDSHVDYVYNADIFRKSFESLLAVPVILEDTVLSSNTVESLTFEFNGNKYLYDIFSGAYLTEILYYFEFPVGSYGEYLGRDIYEYLNKVYDAFILLFGHRTSLRYGDYFVTSRPSPLAVGDTSVSVDVDNAQVSVIDITKKIQYQRFLNAVNLARQNVGDYARSVLGLDSADDISYDIPAFLGHVSTSVRGMEVENTGDGQRDANSVTTLLRANGNNYAFELKTKRPCLIYGVYSFDVARIYSKSFDRMHMHENRFDDFIPQLQYVGDQSLYRRELNSCSDPDAVFGYSVRYMEYKIRHHYAAGGAVESLPSWFFITDGIDGDVGDKNISPDYIRSRPSEFDRFYSSLSGYSLGTYFHFIVMTTNHQELTRKMEYAPEPLK